MMDEVAMFDVALSVQEIEILMTGDVAVNPLNKAASTWGDIKSRAVQH